MNSHLKPGPLPWLAAGLLLAGLALISSVRADADRITLYPGFSDGQRLLIEGRIIEARESAPAGVEDGRLTNLWRNARHFFNDERHSQALQLKVGDTAWPLRSDQEGYFRLDANQPLTPGWHPVSAASQGNGGHGRLLVVPPENRLGLISDLDDTIQISEVTSKRRLLANTFLKNPAQRQAVPGTAALYARVAAASPRPDAAPLFYLSASPRQLHDNIAEFLDRNGFPAGVLLTKRVSDDGDSDPLLDQFVYKTRKIEDIMVRLPRVRFILVGDDGEKDPEIYDWVRQRHPDRVAAIWIRRVSPDPARYRPTGQRDLAEVLARVLDTAQASNLTNGALPELAP